MKNIRIKNTALTNIGDLKFIFRARIIHQSLINHADIFINPPVSIETMGEAIDALNEKYIKAQDGSYRAKSERDLQRNMVLVMLQQTGAYVIGVANTLDTFQEKKVLVEMAGFVVSKDPNSRVGQIEPAKNLKPTTSGIPGSGRVDLRWKRGGRGAYSFSVFAAHQNGDEATEWTTLGISTSTKFTATGLQPGVWSFKVVAHGAAGPAPASQVVSITVG